MEAADGSNPSSKVIVQCIDPHGLFDRIHSDLESRQPLGNLHWKSPTRPLRSIDKLNVLYIRGDQNAENPHTARRHQIPGLRQTPFVKLYLLRCDDRETYKEQTRKDIKQWLKSQGLSEDGKTSTKGQERHDAFEWIILHVVLPNTPAATQPKSAKHVLVEANESTDSVNSKSVWTGKSASTIYDKLRADFSSSSKSRFERVAQIRIQDATKPVTSANNTENQELWQDFIEKLKSAILGSFDARVAQYEDDIRDRDSQRNLPGWNFCTFFILKEGLARGFQNGGLLEDALTVYEELDAGLDDVCREQSKSGDPDSAGALLPFSIDLKADIRSALDTPHNEEQDTQNISGKPDLNALIQLERKSAPFNPTRSDYQQRILTNQVSSLDLRIYIFTRKLNIMFQKAANSAYKNKSKTNNDRPAPKHDVSVVADIVEQAVGFISFAARALRQDLYAAWGGQSGLHGEELQTQQVVIENIVASWKVSAVMQILDECRIPQILAEEFRDSSLPHRQNIGNDSGSGIASNNRTTNTSNTEVAVLNAQHHSNDKVDRRQSTMISLTQSSSTQPAVVTSDSYRRLSLWTAELLVMVRDLVGSINPSAVPEPISNTAALFEKPAATRVVDSLQSASGLRSPTLRLVFQSSQTCMNIYALLTVYAYQCYITAAQIQASRQALLSLARLEVLKSNRNLAIQWLEMVPDLDRLQARTITDFSVLAFYTRCLRDQHRPNERARSLLSILRASSTRLGAMTIASTGIDIQRILNNLVMEAEKADQCELLFNDLFTLGHIERSIKHSESVDGFFLAVSFSINIAAKLAIRQPISLNLISTNSSDPSEITMNSKPAIDLGNELKSIEFASNVSVFGWYELDSMVLMLGNLRFVHQFRATSRDRDHDRRLQAPSSWPIMVYPRAGTISLTTRQAGLTDLTGARHIQVVVAVGGSDIDDAIFRIRPGTAGVRLNISATTHHGSKGTESFKLLTSDQKIAISIHRLKAGNDITFDIPYTLEDTTIENVCVKFEIEYFISGVEHRAYVVQDVKVALPITINVQDVFQADRLFSRFSAGPADIVPLTVLNWQVEENNAYHVKSGSNIDDSIYAFPKLPVSWVVEVCEREHGSQTNTRMPLLVHYRCLDDTILDAIETLLLQDLTQDSMAFAIPLLQSHLRGKVPRLWTEHDLEAIALLQEISMWSYEQMDWQQILQGLSKQDRTDIEAHLRTWHSKHTRIDLQSTDQDSHTKFTRTLRLMVDIPQPTIIISLEIRFSVTQADKDSPLKYIILGRPVKADLLISTKHKLASNEAVEIYYDITGQAEIWTVGGKKRGLFHATEEKIRVPILLVPQRTGHLLYPAVDIRCRRVIESHNPESQARNKETQDPAMVKYEVDNKSQARSILVISGLQGVTVAMGSVIERGMGAGVGREGYAVVESRYRTVN